MPTQITFKTRPGTCFLLTPKTFQRLPTRHPLKQINVLKLNPLIINAL